MYLIWVLIGFPILADRYSIYVLLKKRREDEARAPIFTKHAN